MPLNPVQVKFVAEVVRPMVESLILFKSKMDAFTLDFANQQTALPVTAVALDDNPAGTAPRTDAPTITGAQVTNLNTFCTNMSAQINAAALNVLVQTAVRSVEQILREKGVPGG